MYSKLDFEKEIDQIWLLYTKSYEYYYCLKKIVKYEKSEYSDLRFISFISYDCWYILIVELCKVFQHDNRNQHFNVYGLLNKLKNNYEKIEYKTQISKAEIDKFYVDFNAPEVIEIRDKIILLRDKFYAHTDRDTDNFVKSISVSLQEVEILFNVLRNFIYEIKSKVFNGHTLFDDDIFLRMDDILKKIESANKIRHEEIIQKFNEETQRFK
jgi:hypothetical protein